MRLIDADELKELIAANVYPICDVFNSRDYGMFWTGGIEKAIDNAPTIDAVEVVRCRDCKFSKDTGDYQDTYQCTSRTHAQDYLVHSLDFCSYGVRKDEPQERSE